MLSGRTSCCCYLESRYNDAAAEPWGALEDLRATFNSAVFRRLRQAMRDQGYRKLCNDPRCASFRCESDINTDTDVGQPKRVTLTATSVCQARCLYCGVCDEPPLPRTPPQDKIRHFVDSLAGIDTLCYTGGDPFALPDELLDIYMLPVWRKSVRMTRFITNGIGLSVQRWGRYCDHPAVWVNITLDTTNPATYVFTRGAPGAYTVHDRLRRIARAYSLAHVQINATITAHNLAEFSDLISFAGEIGAGSISPNPVAPHTPLKRGPQAANIFGPGCTEQSYLECRRRAIEWAHSAKSAGVRLVNLQRFLRVNEAAWAAKQNGDPMK